MESRVLGDHIEWHDVDGHRIRVACDCPLVENHTFTEWQQQFAPTRLRAAADREPCVT